MKNTKTYKLDSSNYRHKLNGYRCSHRNKWCLLNSALSPSAFLLFEFYLDIFDFDHKHQSFGTFKVDYNKLSDLFSCSVNSVRSWHKEIQNLGLIAKTEEKKVFRLVNCERYIFPGFWKGKASSFAKLEKNQSTENILQIMSEKFQPIDKNAQETETIVTKDLKQSVSIALGSSKYSSKVSYINAEFTEEDKEWLEKNS